MKRKIVVSILLIAFALSVIGCNKDTSADSSYVAKVNGQVITQKQLDERLEQTAAMYNVDINDPQFAETKDMFALQILEGMIEETLLLNEAKNRKLKVKDEDIDAELATIKSQFNTEQEFEDVLEKNMNLTEKEFKNMLRDQLLMEALIEDVTKDITSTDTDIEQYYEDNKEEFYQEEQVRARHILVKTEEEAKKIIKQIVEEGEDFAQLATLKSTGPSAKDGGDLGYFGKGAMVKPFEDAAFALEVGEVAKDPVQTQFGYHVIKVEDKKEAKQLTFEEVKEDLEARFVYSEKEEEFLSFKEELRADAEIENKLAEKIEEQEKQKDKEEQEGQEEKDKK